MSACSQGSEKSRYKAHERVHLVIVVVLGILGVRSAGGERIRVEVVGSHEDRCRLCVIGVWSARGVRCALHESTHPGAEDRPDLPAAWPSTSCASVPILDEMHVKRALSAVILPPQLLPAVCTDEKDRERAALLIVKAGEDDRGDVRHVGAEGAAEDMTVLTSRGSEGSLEKIPTLEFAVFLDGEPAGWMVEVLRGGVAGMGSEVVSSL